MVGLPHTSRWIEMGLYTHILRCINSVKCPVCVCEHVYYFFMCVCVVITVTSAPLAKQLANMLIKTTPAGKFTTPIKHTHARTRTLRGRIMERFTACLCVCLPLLQFTGRWERLCKQQLLSVCIVWKILRFSLIFLLLLGLNDAFALSAPAAAFLFSSPDDGFCGINRFHLLSFTNFKLHS